MSDKTRPSVRRDWRATTASAIALLLVVWFFHWTVDSEKGFQPPGDGDYYHLLVQGWMRGQLSLKKTPPAELLALSDPYDPAQNAAYRLADASFYEGKYHLYFGVGPALALLMPYELITGEGLSIGAAVFVFCSGAFLTASGLWLAVRRRYFPQSAVWVGPLGVLALGLGTHGLALLRRPMMWELPIAAGGMFSLCALAAVYVALHGRRPVLALGCAGFFLGLAVASRPPCLMGAGMLLPAIWLLWRERRDGVWWRAAVAAGAGLGVWGVGLLAHNFARFGSAFEFGQKYQLSGMHENKLQHFGLSFVARNISVYFFQPLHGTWDFPFVSEWTRASDIPGYFSGEEMCGLAVTFPFLWLVLALPLAWRVRAGKEARQWSATIASVALLFFGMVACLLTFFSATERYVSDFSPALGLLALCGWLGWERWGQTRRYGWLVSPVAAGAALITVAMGVLVSFDYHQRMLSREDPALWQRMSVTSQNVLERAGLWLGQFQGPRVLKVSFVPRPIGTVETFWRSANQPASERVLVEYIGSREVRFGYAREAMPVRWGRPLTWVENHVHTVEVQLPSLYGPAQGPMRELRSDLEFRERTSMAVWFSGGRALEEVAEPWPLTNAIGGDFGNDFSGKGKSAGTRLYRDDETTLHRPDAATSARGGTLHLRLRLPDRLDPSGEPLLATGVLYGSDMVFVREADGGNVQVVFEHFAQTRLESTPVRPGPRREMTLDIVLPSCARRAFGRDATGEVRVAANGREILHGKSACHEFVKGTESVGRNPFGTSCGRAFRGWMFEARWTGEETR